MRVQITPGAIAFTVMSRGPNSLAQPRTILLSAPLAAAYVIMPETPPLRALIEELMMILPVWSGSRGITCLTQKNTDLQFKSNPLSQSSLDSSAVGRTSVGFP